MPCYLYLAFALFSLSGVSASAEQPQSLDVPDGERLLVFAPHPDDEVLGTGGLIQQVLARKGRVRVAIVTAGDGYVEAVEHETGKLHPKPADYLNYGKTRLAEARRADRALGHGRIRLDLLGFPDGGLHPMLIAHWNQVHPERSVTTGVSEVPYPEAEDPNLAYDGADLRAQLLHILIKTQPTLVAFPDAMDKHPDHDGLGMFALLALDDWMAERHRSEHKPVRWPRLIAYLIHWRPPWPARPDTSTPPDMRGTPFALPDDLPLRGHRRACVELTAHEQDAKHTALAHYQTQQRAMGPFLAAFVRSTECFSVLTSRDAHAIDRQVGKAWRSRQSLSGAAMSISASLSH